MNTFSFTCFLSKVRYKSFLLDFLYCSCTATSEIAIIIAAEVSEIVEEFHDGARWFTMMHDKVRLHCPL